MWRNNIMAQLILHREGSGAVQEAFKFFLTKILRLMVRAFYIFPVRNNRLIFYSYTGKQYSCNPCAISEYIQNNFKDKYEIVWAFIEPNDFKYLENRGIKCVKYFSLMRMYYEATAKASINNSGAYMWFPIRKNQIHVNTWHGGGCYKRLASSEKTKSIFYKKIFLLRSKETTHFISSSSFFSEYVIRKECGYTGKILEYGMPRNDIMFQESSHIKEIIVKKYNCDKGKMIILYAPTWRYQADLHTPNLAKISEAVKIHFGKECIFLFRAHNSMNMYENNPNLIDVSDYPDMQDLLCACDILITDYSSSIWDYSFTYKPCFLYTPDLEKYVKERGFGKDIYSWGFPVCKTDEELYQAIINFDEAEFKKKMEKHHVDLGSFEDGNATKRVCEYLIKEMEK